MQKFHPKGVIPALVTPFTPDGKRIQADSLKKLINFQIDNGMHGIFVSGSQGEAWALSFEERVELMEMTVDFVAGRVPVYGGTGCITTEETVRLTQEAKRVKVDVVSVITPFFITPSQDELYEHYKAVAAVGIPTMPYPNFARTQVRFLPSLLSRLMEFDTIVGIKDSSGDLSLGLSYLRAVEGKNCSVLIGRDTLIYAGLVYGASGAIAAGGNVAPRLMSGIYNDFQKGNLDAAMAAQSAIEPLRVAFDLGTFPVVVKEALNMMGFEVGPCRRPIGPLTEPMRQRLREVLDNLPTC